MKREEKLKEIDELATLSLQKASTAISAIECAVTAWENSKQKPIKLKKRLERLREVYGVFSDWERKMLRAMAARKPSEESRIALLKQFSEICMRYG